MNIYKSDRHTFVNSPKRSGIVICNCDLISVHSQLATAASVRVLLSGDVPHAHLEVAVVVGLDEGVYGAHDALLVAVVVVMVVRSTHRKAVSAKTMIDNKRNKEQNATDLDFFEFLRFAELRKLVTVSYSWGKQQLVIPGLSNVVGNGGEVRRVEHGGRGVGREIGLPPNKMAKRLCRNSMLFFIVCLIEKYKIILHRLF